jgi:hypothetical protein
MIDRTFVKNKYRRTYIGGSKEKELNIFRQVQGTKEDNSECDWLEYRRILTAYLDDVLNVIFSWKNLTQKISFVLLILSMVLFKFPLIFPIILFLSITSMIIHLKLSAVEKKKLKDYDYCLDVTLNEIRKQTGLILDKN